MNGLLVLLLMRMHVQQLFLFDFCLMEKKYIATIYEDGKDADWEKNPQSYHIFKAVVTNKSVLKQKLARSGGSSYQYC